MKRALVSAASSLALLLAGLWGLSVATDGFRAFTTQSARAVAVARQRPPVPDARFEDQAGRQWALDELAGKWLVVDFMYTRCTTLCSVLGSRLAQVQEQLAGPIAAGRVQLLSISFDPGHDAPAELAGYLRRFGRHGEGWAAVRPLDAGALAALKRTFGITVIDDGRGGYTHNDGFGIVSPEGRLVAIADADSPASAVAGLVRARLAPSRS